MSAQRRLADFTEPATTNTDNDEAEAERDELAAIFYGVAGTDTIVDEQAETPSHEPIVRDEGETPDVTEDGLEDAAASDYNGGLW